MDLATLWIPSQHDDHLRAGYRDALLRGGWRVGPWRRVALTALREGLTHACLPTAAGTFFVPPHPFDLAALTASLSARVRGAMLTVDDDALRVFSEGQERERFARWGSDPAAVARALGVAVEQVALLLDPSEADERSSAGASGAERDGAAWELTSLRLMP
ncbi:MAG: hypothetical protein R3A48_05540 [Polyangiales bacterium]